MCSAVHVLNELVDFDCSLVVVAVQIDWVCVAQQHEGDTTPRDNGHNNKKEQQAPFRVCFHVLFPVKVHLDGGQRGNGVVLRGPADASEVASGVCEHHPNEVKELARAVAHSEPRDQVLIVGEGKGDLEGL